MEEISLETDQSFMHSHERYSINRVQLSTFECQILISLSSSINWNIFIHIIFIHIINNLKNNLKLNENINNQIKILILLQILVF